MNPTARVGSTHMLDTLLASSMNITALFAPEHGFRGEFGAGEVIRDGVDKATGLPVYSLYGDTKKPTDGMLKKVDLLLFDMQDVGARFYTYNITLGNVIKAATSNDVEVWVLDRPNPAGGYVAGWRLEAEYKSFVGKYPIPMAHGMTLGELGRMMIGEGWLDLNKSANYRVIAMKGWSRDMLWPETGLDWHAPSPNLPTFKHAYVYLGTVLFEGTTLSEGRGTDDPFLQIGHPEFEYQKPVMDSISRRYNVTMESTTFTPRSIKGKAPNPKHEGEHCEGVRISISDLNRFDEPVAFGADLLRVMLDHTKSGTIKPFLYNLAGTKKRIERFIKNDKLLPSDAWKNDKLEFLKLRRKYLLYP